MKKKTIPKQKKSKLRERERESCNWMPKKSLLTWNQTLIPPPTCSLKQESMKLMGLNSSIYWASWLVKSSIYLVISSAVYCILFSIEVSDKGKVLAKTDPSLFFVFLICYSISIICFCFMVSTFFNKGNFGLHVLYNFELYHDVTKSSVFLLDFFYILTHFKMIIKNSMHSCNFEKF